MPVRVEVVRLPPVADDQAVEQAEQILESGRWRWLLRWLGERRRAEGEKG